MGFPLQRNRFAAGEGDAWFFRNRQQLIDNREQCPVLRIVSRIEPRPSRVLEIGCSNGWRLDKIMASGAKECVGIDPSEAAIEDGGRRFPALQLHKGTAERLPPRLGRFDLIIFGFCLSWCDPADHFTIVAQADKRLSDRGHLVIYDFDPLSPYRNRYSHADGVYSYKMDYARLFLAHPHYSLRERIAFVPRGERVAGADARLAVSLLTKNTRLAWPFNPWQDEAD